MKWFKFYGQDWLTDTKIFSMKLEDKLCYLTLLCLASSSTDGVIKNCTEDTVLRLSGLQFDPANEDNEYSRAIGCLKRYHDNGMITHDNKGGVIINAYSKRQGSNLGGYERIKRFREKKKMALNIDKNKTNDNTNDNISDNTNDNPRIDKIRIEENRIEERENTEDTPSQVSIDFFLKGRFYEEYLALFSKTSPEELVSREFDKFILYWTEPNGSGTKQRWQQQSTFDVKRRLITWFGKVNTFTKTSKQRIVL